MHVPTRRLHLLPPALTIASAMCLRVGYVLTTNLMARLFLIGIGTRMLLADIRT